MKRLFLIYSCFIFLVACQQKPKILTLKMEQEANSIVLNYLEKHNLPEQTLQSFKSRALPKPDFSYIYTGGGRCIEFIINCTNGKCSKLESYPYDVHGEKCPLTK